ncbi:MAG: aryl-sulfate sulfotransferase [Planctomycetes bacterium]|nr:aryl-sulfate sulfotransferase [Planctomycetota bacterium]
MRKPVWALLFTLQIVVGVMATLLAVGCREKPAQGDSLVEDAAESSPDNASAAQDDREAPQRNRGRKRGDRTRGRSKSRLDDIGYVGYADESAADDESGVVVNDPQRSYPGYNLVTFVKPRRAELIDSAGKLVNVWHQGDTGQWERSVLLDNGDLLVVSFTNPHSLLRLTWDNEVVWTREGMWHHDVTQTPDGTLAALLWAYRRVPAIHAEIDIMDSIISRFSPESEADERRSLYDVLAARPDMFTFGKGRRRQASEGRKERIDLIHANSLRWIEITDPPTDSPIYQAGNVIVCLRHQDTVVIFNWETSELLWVWGRGEVVGPHDAQVLANGNILIFDNGSRENKRSRVVEVDPLTKKMVWKYEAPNPRDFYSTARGGNQRLPNGNTLITESNEGRAFEVTPEGEIVWKYYGTHRDEKSRLAAINRCYRYETAMVQGLLDRFGGQVNPTEEPETE